MRPVVFASCRRLLTCLTVMAGLASPVAADDQPAETEEPAVWVTSIARLGESSDFVAATADGLLLREAHVVSFSAANPAELKTLYQHPAAVWCVDASADGKWVASVDYRGNLMIYDTASRQVKAHEKAFERWCQAMMISPDAKQVVAGNEAGKVMIWDLGSGKMAGSAELDGHAVTGLALSPDHSQLAVSDGGGHVHLLSYPQLEVVGKIKLSEESSWSVVYSLDGKHLFAGSSDRNLYRCAAEPEAKPESVAKGTDWITRLAVSPAGQIAAAEVGGKLHFPSLGGSHSMDAKSGVWSLCWQGDEQLFAGTRKDGITVATRSWKWAEPAAPSEETASAPAEEQPAEEASEADAEKEAPKDE